jgi:hypothetical protein
LQGLLKKNEVYDPASLELFLHSMDCLMAQGEHKPFPEPPEAVRAIAYLAKDRGAALSRVYGGGSFDIFPYDVEALVERGEIVPRSMVAGRELAEPLEDPSEP